MALLTDLDDGDIGALLADFGLGLRSARHIHGGMSNTSYRVDTDQGPFVLTVLDHADANGAAQLVDLLEVLCAHGVSTSVPRRTIDGSPSRLFGARPVLVKGWVEGVVPLPATPTCLQAAGAALAHVHAVPPPSSLEAAKRRLPADLGAATARFGDRRLADWLGSVAERCAPVLAAATPSGLCHGDLFPDNLVLGSAGASGAATLTVLDWECASVDLFVLDVGMAVVGLCRDRGSLVPGRLYDLLAGYGSVRPLEPAERDVLPAAVEHAAAVIAYRRYRQHHITHPDPSKATIHEEMYGFVESVRHHLPDPAT